jgi:G3E family GTPase
VSTKHPIFILVGGFLGAGKTTAVARLARRYADQGLKVAIVTNDQTNNLVDTHSLEQQGFHVGEVAGACFCCNFNELTSTVEKLSAEERPDVIIAEPVGSCTDLVATVIRPLVQVYQQPFDMRPYGVIIKPSHGLRILKGQEKSGFSPKAAYIFEKQIEEADFVVINRIDELAARDVEELTRLLDEKFPGRPVLRMSAKTGDGFEAYAEFLNQRGEFGQRVMELDYDIYAEGEAELGWLNSNIKVEAEHPFPLDALLLSVVERLKTALAAEQAETAHLKAIGLWEGFYGVANLVSSFTQPELSLPSNSQVKEAQLVVNARVAIDPDRLKEIVELCVREACQDHRARPEILSIQSFRPGRPVPIHRISSVAAS